MGFDIYSEDLIFYKEEKGITEAVIPEEIKKISYRTFSECKYLESIFIPDAVTDINYDAFCDCTALKEIKVSASNPAYTSRDGILYNKFFTELIYHPGSREHIHIPHTVSRIADTAFSGNQNLIKITISPFNFHFIMHDGVLYTRDMKKLVCCPKDKKSIIIPDTITDIGNYAFQYCEALTDVQFPPKLKRIHRNAFHYCTNLKDVIFPPSLKLIDDSAFRECHSLKHVIIPDGTQEIKSSAFVNCRNLESIVIPESVKKAGSLFQGSRNLNHVTCHGIEMRAFADHNQWHMTSGNTDALCKQMDIDSFFQRFVRRICQREFDEDILYVPPELKYDILLQLYAHHPHEKEISDAVQKYVTEICQYQMQRISPEKFSMILDSIRHFITKQNLSDLIIYANEQKNYEMQIMLTEYKNKYIGYESTEEKLRKWKL